MGTGRDIVVTAYGHENIIDKIAVSAFDTHVSRNDLGHYGGGYYGQSESSDAATYCDTLNALDLTGDSWVFARIVSENAQYGLDSFVPMKIDILLKLDDRSLQRVLREVDSRDIALVLKGENEALKEKVFRNMSTRMVQILKEDLEIMGPVMEVFVKKSRERIIGVIRHLESIGEIVIVP